MMQGSARHRASWMAVLIVLVALSGCSEEGGRPAVCAICGADATAGKGRFTIRFEDGAGVEACSGFCAAQIVMREGTPPRKVRVYGHDVEKMIDATKAVYVLGADRIPEKSKAPSVFAFSKEEAAAEFVEKHGGRLTTLEHVLDMARPPGESGP